MALEIWVAVAFLACFFASKWENTIEAAKQKSANTAVIVTA